MNLTEFRKVRREVLRKQNRRDRLAKIAKYLRGTYEYRKGIISCTIDQDSLDIIVFDGPNGLGKDYLNPGFFCDVIHNEIDLCYPAALISVNRETAKPEIMIY